MNYKFINRLIKNRKGKELAKLFDIEVDLSKVKTSRIFSPFEDLFERQQYFIKAQTYENAEEVVKSTLILLDEDDYTNHIIKKVIKNCLVVLYDQNEQKNKEALAKILFGFTKVSSDIKYYVFNVLSQLYFEMGKFELLENQLLVSTNTRNRKLDYYVFNLYKGITLFYLDRFKESFKSLSIAFKSKKIKKSCAFPYFLCAMLNGKFIKKEALIKYNCERLLPLSYNLKNGLFKQVSYNLKDLSDDLISFFIFRACYTYIPLVALRNLIKRLYFMFSIEAKLEIEKISKATGCNTLEIYSFISALIDLDLIKGYVSVNREIIVFSKVEPFPNEINL